MTDAEIVERTEKAAAHLLLWKHNMVPEVEGAQLRHSKNVLAKSAWLMACEIQEILTDSDAVNAAQEVDDSERAEP